MAPVSIGVDIGQKHDPTAIAVVQPERRTLEEGDSEWHFLVRHLEWLPLGTSYPEVGRRVAAVAAGVVAVVGGQPTLYIDATGVGQPVVDVLREAGVRGHLWPVYFTYGDRRVVEGGEIRLGKGRLVSRLQVLLQAGRLHLPGDAEAEALTAELFDYEIRASEDANERYGAFKVGTHDDLVTALGLAVQEDPTEYVIASWIFDNEARSKGELWAPPLWGDEARERHDDGWY